MNIPASNLPRVVVIGGGFGGLQFVKSLNANKFQVVLIDKHNYHTFQPLLYQVATAGLEPDSIAYPLRKVFRNRPNFFFRICEVQRISADSKTISTSEGVLNYDYMVIATGSSTNFFGNQEIATNAMSMKTVPQALDLRSLLLQNFERALYNTDLKERERLMNFVVVGGGPTGTELAGALAELKLHVLPTDYPDLDFNNMRIHLIEASGELLGAMSASASKKALSYLKKLGVQVWLDTAVTSYDGKTIATSTGDSIATRYMIWAAGVAGNPIPGIEQAMNKGSRIKVNTYNQVEGFEHVFAIGDIASMESDSYPKGHPMMAQPAIQQGALAAKNLERMHDQRPLKAFKYRDKGSMATIGRNKAVADLGKLHFAGIAAWFVWMLVHLMALVGFRNRAVTLVNWTIAYFKYEKGERLIIRPYNPKKST